MPAYLPYEVTKSIEEIVSDPEVAKKVINTIEESLSAIEEKAKEQKGIIKNELKDELTKELVTKEELKATEERLKKGIEEVRGELKITEERLKREIEEVRGEIRATEEKLRGEIKSTEERLRGEIRSTEERLRTEIHRWRADTIKWMFIFWIGQLVAFVGILKFMLK